jgi:hypothetical protein
VTNPSKHTLAAEFSSLRIAASDPAVALQDDGSFTTALNMSVAEKGELTASFRIDASRAGAYTSSLFSSC